MRLFPAGGFEGMLGPLQQEFGDLLRNGIGKSERANLVVSAFAIVRELLRNFHADFGIVQQEAAEVSLRDEVGLRLLEGLDRRLIGGIGNSGGESQHFTGLSDSQDDALTVA